MTSRAVPAWVSDTLPEFVVVIEVVPEAVTWKVPLLAELVNPETVTYIPA